MQINQLPPASSLNNSDKFAVDTTDGITKSITASALVALTRTNSYGSPLVADTVTAMTDTSKVYVYTGNETGYTNGDWYYYNGTAWVSGGAYNSVAVNTDTTLRLSGVAADAKAVGDADARLSADITALENTIGDQIEDIFLNTATDYDSLSFPVSKGQYCLRRTNLFKARQDIPTIEAWNIAHWERVNVGNELYGVGEGIESAVAAEATAREAADDELKGTLYPPNEGIISVSQSQIVQGSYNSSGAVVTSDSRIRTSGYIAVYSGEKIKFTPGTNIKQMLYGAFDQDKHFISDGTWSTGGIIDINWDGYIIMQWRKSANNESITPSDYDAQTAFVTNTYERIEGNTTDIDNILSDLSDLESALSITNLFRVISISDLEQGTYNANGVKANGNTRIRTKNKIRIKRGVTVKFTEGTTIKSWAYVSYDENGNKFFASSWLTGDSLIRLASKTGYIVLILKKDDTTTITPNSFDATLSINIYNEYDMVVDLENGALTSSGANRFQIGYHDSHRRNKYPLMFNNNNAVMLPVGTGTIIFCDSSGTVISAHNMSTNGNAFFDVPSNAAYMDVDIRGTDKDVTITVFGTDSPYFGKRVYTNNGDTIRQDVNIEGTLYTDMAYKLPVNYSQTGNPVPLVLWIAGNNGYINIGDGFPNSAVTGLNYLRDEGYAILQVFSWGSYYANKYPNCGKDQPYPVPISLRCIESGIKYFIDRYNIDGNNIHVISRSFGGQMALHYALHPFDGLKSVTLFDPVIDFLSMRGRFSDARKALVEELSFNGTEAMLEDFYDINEDGSSEDMSQGLNYYFSERCQPLWEINIPALVRLNVSWDNLIGDILSNNYAKSLADAREWWFNGKDNTDPTIYNHNEYKVISTVPVKVCGALDDASTPLQAMTEKIAQLRNSGNPAETYFVATGGHDAVSVSTTYAQTITTSLGIVCENVPIGWIEAMKWVRKNS